MLVLLPAVDAGSSNQPADVARTPAHCKPEKFGRYTQSCVQFFGLVRQQKLVQQAVEFCWTLTRVHLGKSMA